MFFKCSFKLRLTLPHTLGTLSLKPALSLSWSGSARILPAALNGFGEESSNILDLLFPGHPVCKR